MKTAIFWILSAILGGDWRGLFGVDAILGYRGKIYELSTLSIRTFDIRADGRYLYYSDGSNRFVPLDLQTMATFGTPTTVDGSVIGLFSLSSGGLAVATTTGVQYAGLSKPLQPTLQTGKYVRPAAASSWTVMDACAGGGKVVLLERHSTQQKHQVRVVTGDSADTSTSWSQLIGSNHSQLSPVAVRCSNTYGLVIATETGYSATEGANDETLWLASFSLADPTVSVPRTISMNNNRSLSESEGGSSNLYFPGDLLISPASDQLVVLFSRESANLLNTEHDSVVVGVPLSTLSLDGAVTRSIGSRARGLATYKVSGGHRLGVFVGKDKLANNPANEDNKLLSVALPLTTASPIDADRGDGSEAVGVLRPSVWKSTIEDFKFGRTEGTGLTLLSDAPRLMIATPPTTTEVTSTQPLELQISADRNSTYEVFVDRSPSDVGTSQGLSRTPETSIESGTLTAGVSQPLSYSAAELALSKNGAFALLIQVKDQDLTGTPPIMRQGVAFSYDPPPGVVSNLQLRFGNQSIYVCFDAPAGSDIASYEIYFSYASSDLESPVASTFDSQVDGRMLNSPMTVLTPGCHGIYPVKNNQLLYVRVRAIDESNQNGDFSTIVSRKAYRTLSIDEALGGPESCALKLETAPHKDEVPKGGLVVAFLTSVFVLGLLRSGRKNWAQHF